MTISSVTSSPSTAQAGAPAESLGYFEKMAQGVQAKYKDLMEGVTFEKDKLLHVINVAGQPDSPEQDKDLAVAMAALMAGKSPITDAVTEHYLAQAPELRARLNAELAQYGGAEKVANIAESSAGGFLLKAIFIIVMGAGLGYLFANANAGPDHYDPKWDGPNR